MRRFTVPQFIEVEDKIFGPLSLKQFVYLLGGGAGLFILYVFLPFVIFIFLGIPLAALAGAFAFLKVNNQPFITVAANAIAYYVGSRLYVWQKPAEPKKRIQELARAKEGLPTGPMLAVPKISEAKLRTLAWSLDVKRNVK